MKRSWIRRSAKPLKRARWSRKPHFWRFKSKGSRITKDGRLILGAADYAELRRQKYREQSGRCADCGMPVVFGNFELHHPGGRGGGGGKRDDRLVVGLCGGPLGCHAKRTREGNR